MDLSISNAVSLVFISGTAICLLLFAFMMILSFKTNSYKIKQNKKYNDLLLLFITEQKQQELENKKKAITRRTYTEKHLSYIVDLMSMVDSHKLVNLEEYEKWEMDLIYTYETINLEMKSFSLQFYAENRTDLRFNEVVNNYVKLINETNKHVIAPAVVNLDQIISQQTLLVITKIIDIISNHHIDYATISPNEVVLKVSDKEVLSRLQALAIYYNLELEEVNNKVSIYLTHAMIEAV
ncbi:MAG: hypothetical protein V4538_00215 [Bacteroidota bacterium]